MVRRPDLCQACGRAKPRSLVFCSRFRLLTMSDEETAATHETMEAIGLATRLLMVAAENSKIVPVDIALPITTAIEAAKHATSPRVEAEFWAAFSQLCRVLQPISVTSFSPEYILAANRQRRAYVISSVALLALLLPLSVGGFLVTALNADLANIDEPTGSPSDRAGICTSRRHPRHGSTRSNASSPCSPTSTSSAAAPIAPPPSWRLLSPPTSTPATPTPSPSAGPNRR